MSPTGTSAVEREIRVRARPETIFPFFTEDSPVRPGTSTVEVTLAADGEDTLVRLVHRDLPSEDSAGAHGEGWDHYLERLAVAGAGGDAGPDPWAERASAEAD